MRLDDTNEAGWKTVRRDDRQTGAEHATDEDGHEGTDALATELQEHVKSVTAPYKYPRVIEFVDALPKTASGKIRRAELRATGRLTRPEEGAV